MATVLVHAVDDAEAAVELDVASFNAAASACKKGGQWQQALGLLAEMQKRQLDLKSSASMQPPAPANRRAVATGLLHAVGDAAAAVGAKSHQLQGSHLRPRVRRAVATGLVHAV